MVRRSLFLIVAIVLLFSLGCSELTGQKQTGSPKPAHPEILKEAQLGSQWKVNHIRMKIATGSESSILLKLAYEDKVDGYFFLEEGNKVNFEITGISLVYEPRVQGAPATGGVASDRFSFTASQAQGISYTLTFRNTDDQKVTVFLEVIYPITGIVFFPLFTD